MSRIKTYTIQERIKKSKPRFKDFIRIPIDFLSDSPVIEKVRTPVDIKNFAEFKAFLLLQNEVYYHKAKPNTPQGEAEDITLSIRDYKRFKPHHTIKETNVIHVFKPSYANFYKNKGFIRLPYKALNGAKGCAGLMVEAVLASYYINDFEDLWVVVCSLFGNKAFRKEHLKRYFERRDSDENVCG